MPIEYLPRTSAASNAKIQKRGVVTYADGATWSAQRDCVLSTSRDIGI
jgi:hypothetical protein